MKRLLLPLLAALALPTAVVNAETWYLMAKGGKGSTYSSIPMASKQECEAQGQRFIDAKNWKGTGGYMLGYVCLKGK